jgi:hypothetical protein
MARGGFGSFKGPRFGRLSDGTIVQLPSGPATGGTAQAPPGSSIPPGAGGNSVQGKGINFVYQTPLVATINHGASSGAQPIQFDNNSTFLWLRSTFVVDIAAAAFLIGTIPIPLITVSIQDTGNGMSFMNAPIPIYTIAGAEGELPYILPTPQLIQPNASYSFSFVNNDAAVNYTNLRMQLHGFRIFNTSITDISQLRGMML